MNKEGLNPASIRIKTKLVTVGVLIERMRNGVLGSVPNITQEVAIWRPQQQCRLIESILIRIPLQAFYFDATEVDEWLVIDGFKRLNALQWFVLGNEPRLYGLEFLKELEGKTHSVLDRHLQRRIEETQVTVHLIETGTPPEVKFNLYERIRASEY